MPFADELLGADVVAELTRCLTLGGYRATATTATSSLFEGMALKARSDLVRDALIVDLPDAFDEFVTAINTLIAQSECTGWMVWPITEAVAVRSTESGRAKNFDAGLVLLRKLTPRLSAEFALRTMLIADADRTLATALRWTTSTDDHVRRLASEGTRQYLPWARRVPALLEHPEMTGPIIDALYRDPSEYVRRSVANHLNDLSRQHADLVVTTAARWLAQPDANTERLVRHALRTLIKRGDPEALALLGYAAPAGITVTDLDIDSQVGIGNKLTMTAIVHNNGSEPVNMVIDYSIGFRKAGGTITHKVFKLATRSLAPGERIDIAKSHSFAPITTRRYYPGAHEFAVQINGRRMATEGFDLTVTEL